MRITKLKIESDALGFGLAPAFNTEVAQQVVIHSDGRVKISRYVAGYQMPSYVKASEEKFNIDEKNAEAILRLAKFCFIDHHREVLAFDAGGWVAKLSCSDGVKRKVYGSLIPTENEEYTKLNRKIREVLHRDYRLFLFDGGYSEEHQKYIYIGVHFRDGGKIYDYLTEDDSIIPGDMVIVPVGPSNHEKPATVVSRDVLTEDEAIAKGRLFPDELKSVIRKIQPIASMKRTAEDVQTAAEEKITSVRSEPSEESADQNLGDSDRGQEINIGSIRLRNDHVLIRKFRKEDTPFCAVIWNEVVRDGMAFPQTEELDEKKAFQFFRNQYTAVAELNGQIVGLYILHPNNVGRVGHIANASYAVSSAFRGLHIGELLVRDCLEQAAKQGYRILQFNAVVASNVHAYHLYKRLGFVDLGVIPGGFRNKKDEYEDIHVLYHQL